MDESAFANDAKDDANREPGKLSEKSEKYIRELTNEKSQLPENMKHAARLLQAEIDNVIKTDDSRFKHRFLDLFLNRPSHVNAKVGFPSKDYPKFNFVGKLLGPKGNTLKRLQEETKCRMLILGRGSIRDKDKEEQLRQSFDKKYMHLHDDLHVDVTAYAQPAEAHARMAYGLAELRKYIIPDNNDEISDVQSRELGYYDEPEDEGYYPGPRREPPAPMNDSYSTPHRNADSGGMRGWGMQRGRARGTTPRGRGITRGGPIGGRGRGGDVGGGRGPVRDDYYDGGYARGDNSGNNAGYDSMGYDNGGGYAPVMGARGGGGDNYDDGGDYRRGGFKESNFGPESGRGQWKQRGGLSRFAERSVPYTRRT